ncbi:MAG: phosphoserine transaminase [Microbacteriaceae bacterium]|nr:phosphoserine transaminase [Microbacteriaceae bacterium]
MTELRIPSELLPSDGRFGCGPSKIREDQLNNLVTKYGPLLGTSHRQSPVKNLVGSVREGLLELFGGENSPAGALGASALDDGYEIVLGNGGASLFWDAAAYSLINRRIQNLVFGEFGGKFVTAASAPHLEPPVVINATPGSFLPAQPQAGVDVYAWPQNETSTGVAAPVKRVSGENVDPDALTVIDATSAAGGMAFDYRELDVYYFAPQKNFGGDGGIWFALMSPKAIERIERIAASDRYIPAILGLKAAIDNSRLNQTLNTPALTSLALIDDQTQWILENGGLNWAAEKTRASSNLLYEWASAHPLTTPFVEVPELRSPVVVTIDIDPSIDALEVSRILRDNGIVDTDSYRKLGRNQLRIATFVSIEQDDVAQLIKSLEFVLGA